VESFWWDLIDKTHSSGLREYCYPCNDNVIVIINPIKSAIRETLETKIQ
jgi:hypothetical protein